MSYSISIRSRAAKTNSGAGALFALCFSFAGVLVIEAIFLVGAAYLILGPGLREQRIQRPKSSKENDQQRPYYSGKKKCHTLKNEIAVQPDGAIGAVSCGLSTSTFSGFCSASASDTSDRIPEFSTASNGTAAFTQDSVALAGDGSPMVSP